MSKFINLGKARRAYFTLAALSTGLVGGSVALVLCGAARAEVPEQARIEDIVGPIGSASQLAMRSGGNRQSVQVGSTLQRHEAALIASAEGNVRAFIDFLSGDDRYLNLRTQVNPNRYEQPTIYHFPCGAQGDYYFDWGLSRGEARGCEQGIKLSGGRLASASLPQASFLSWLKQLSQAPTRKLFYCSVTSASGVTFNTAPSGDPCTPILEECQAANDPGCQVSTRGFWWTSDEKLQASLDCLSAGKHSASGDGNTIDARVQELLQATPGLDDSCQLHVYKPSEMVIFPAPDEIVLAEGDERVFVQVSNTPEGTQVDVLEGVINIRTVHNAGDERLSVRKGERYIHSGKAANPVTAFDRESSLKSIDMEVFCAFASYPENNIDPSLCFDAGHLPTKDGGPILFCSREHASGGQEGDERELQMNVVSGEIVIDYDMFDVPDLLQIWQGDRNLLDTGYISGTGQISVPFDGNSGKLSIKITGNPDIPTTEWNYTLYCSD